MNLSSIQIAQMADAAGRIIFGETFAAPKDGDPIWVKQTWDRVVAAIEASLTQFPDGDVDKFTRAHIRESALCEAADWHQSEASRKRACEEKNRTLRAQIATHMVSEAAIRALVNQSDVTTLAPSPRAQALDSAVVNFAKNLLCSLDPENDLDDPEKFIAWHNLDDAIRALSSPLADGEYEIDYEVICNGDFVAGSSDLADAKHYAAVYAQDGPVEIIEARTYRRPLPASPGASE